MQSQCAKDDTLAKSQKYINEKMQIQKISQRKKHVDCGEIIPAAFRGFAAMRPQDEEEERGLMWCFFILVFPNWGLCWLTLGIK